MRLSEKAIKAINTIEIRPLLQIELKKHAKSIERYITDNDDNGPLTSVGVLAVIRKETGLTDPEIFEPVPATA